MIQIVFNSYYWMHTMTSTKRKGKRKSFSHVVKSFISNPWSACTNIYKKWTLSLFLCTFCSTRLTWGRQEDGDERGTIQDSQFYHLYIHQYVSVSQISFRCLEVTFTVHSSSSNRLHTYRRQNNWSRHCHDSNPLQSNHATHIIKCFNFICIFIWCNLKIFMCSLYNKK